MDNPSKENECCPRFVPEPWDGKIFQWENKRFIRDKVLTFFFMPLNFGSVMRRLNAKVEKSGATIPDWLCLSDHTSGWNMNLYLAVDKEVTHAENITLTGKYFSKVYEGPFRDTKKWCNDFENEVKSKGLELKKMYLWYTTCPKCAKKYRKNYVVIIGSI
jgi:hypothetical protein